MYQKEKGKIHAVVFWLGIPNAIESVLDLNILN